MNSWAMSVFGADSVCGDGVELDWGVIVYGESFEGVGVVGTVVDLNIAADEDDNGKDADVDEGLA
jgi:hypothetical protein